MGPLQRCLKAQNTVWVSVFRIFQNFFDGQSASVDARGAWRSNHHAICFFFCLFWKISKKFSVKLTIYYNESCRILAVICFWIWSQNSTSSTLADWIWKLNTAFILLQPVKSIVLIISVLKWCCLISLKVLSFPSQE